MRRQEVDIARICRIGGLVVLVALICLPAISLLPPESKHSHEPGVHDELTKIPRDKSSQLAQVVEPAFDAAHGVQDLISTEPSHAHYPFPKFCGHYIASKPNHTYYPQRYYNSGGYHYHSGVMDHGVGSDYNFTYRCGGTHHYRDFPQGWF